MSAEERRQYKDFAETVLHSDAELARIAKYGPSLTKEIRKGYEDLRNELSVGILREADVETLNRNHDGIRVNALRDAGLKTVADVCRASQRSLESIPGFGKVMAAKTKRNAEALRMEAARTIKVAIDPEKTSPVKRKLVFALGKYLHLKEYIERAEGLYAESHEGIMVRLQVSECIGNGFGWFFRSNERKQQALLAYDELREYVSSSYAPEATAVFNGARAVDELTEWKAWSEFTLNSASYYALLYALTDGNTEAQSHYGGIPEQLVDEVNAVELRTEALRASLRRYQTFGTKYILYEKRVLLGDEMGLGKTIEAIAAMAHLRAEGKTHFLVVCPLSVLVNWKREVAKFSAVPVDEIYGNDRTEELQEWLEKGGTAITTYETASRIELPDRFAVDLLIIDEAQYVKNPEAQRSKAVRRLIGRSQMVLMMSGTPLENHVGEMIALIECLQPEVAAKAKRLTSLAEAEAFRREIAPVYLRRTREQVLKELPDKEEIQEWGTMTPEEEQVYRKTLCDGNFMEIRRISWNCPNPSASTKAQRLLEICEEAEADGRKCIVFSFFRDTLKNVAMLLGERCAGVIDGSMPMAKRQEVLDGFQSGNGKPVLACQVVAGGVGLNVQAASVIIFCEPQMKPSMEEQAIGRAYRMGQSRKVMVHRLLISDSVDERILAVLERKQEAFQAFAEESVVGRIDSEREISQAVLEEIVSEERKKYSIGDDGDGSPSDEQEK